MTYRRPFASAWTLVALLAASSALAANANEELPASWLAQVEQQIRDSEYHFSLQPDGEWSAPNRAHGLRVASTHGGVALTSRTRGAAEADGGFELRLALAAWGRHGAMRSAGELRYHTDEGRLELAHDAITEWYVNTPDGLKHGFNIDASPDPGERHGALILEMSVGGGLGAFLSEDGQEVLFKSGSGAAVLRYAGLRVIDASTRDVPARMRFHEGKLQLHIDDAAALYPLQVDPLITAPIWTADGNQIGAELGYAVATAGDVNGDGYSDVLVAAEQFDNGSNDEGCVFLYHGSPSGLITVPAWAAEGDQLNARFGHSVGAAGDVDDDGYGDVIIGAYLYDNGQTDEGRAYVYRGGSEGLAGAPWTAESDQGTAYFGTAVGTAGDVDGDGYSDVIIGASLYDNGTADEGRVYVYRGSAAGLAGAPWTAESNDNSANFGESVSTAGDVNGDGYSDVIVGTPLSGDVTKGAAFVYHGSAGGLPASATWSALSAQTGSYFGGSVATAGDVNGDGYADVIIGAYSYDNGHTDEGQAYVYHGSSGGLAASPAWTTESNQATAFHGWSVGTAGDVNGDGYADVIVGSDTFDNGQSNEGRALVYHGSSTGLSATPSFTVETDQADALVGWSVGTAGDVNGDGYSEIAVGAKFYDTGQIDEGRAYVYYGAAAGLGASSAWSTEANQNSAFLGESIASAGDVNGDGYSDAIVGVRSYDTGLPSVGRAFFYTGSAAGLTTTASWTATGSHAGARLGASVASAGDVNGDGYSDVIVGAYGYGNGQTNEGRAYVFHGSAAGLSVAASWTAESDQATAQFGIAVASAGDVNGDGYSDVIVGADLYDNDQSNEGRAFVYHGSAAGLSTAASWTAEGDQVDAAFGRCVATAGDLNGDGYSDLVVGAPDYDNGQTDEGRAFAYHGSSAGSASAPAWTTEGDQADANFGHSVASAGDVNADGYADVVVGAISYDNGQLDEGEALVYHGSVIGLAATPSWTAQGDQAGAAFGVSATTAGDIDGDGYSDVVVGAYFYDNGQANEGRAFLYLGSAAGLATTAAWTAESDQANASFGVSVAPAGDVNGDGFGDVFVGANGYDNGQADEGRAFLYYGNGGDGLDRIARQRRADGTAPIAPLGKSDSQTSFRLRALGRTPAGRGKVRLQWERRLLGESFDGTAVAQGSSATDTGSPAGGSSSVAVEETLTGLEEERVHHWRLRLATDSPFFPRSPWLTLPHNGPNEADVRTTGADGPLVVEVTPADGARRVPPGANVVVSFSEDVSASTITTTTVRLLDGGKPVSAVVRLSPSRRIATLDPTSALSEDTTYDVAVNGVQDLAGNVGDGFTSSFRVAATPPVDGEPLPNIASRVDAPAGATTALIGSAVARAGDLDRDGVDDFVAGAPGYQAGANVEAGAAIVYLGTAEDDARPVPDLVFTGAAAHDRAGVSVSGDFDFDGDGIKDLLIGAEQVDRATNPNSPSATGAGKAYVIYFDPADYDFDANFVPDYLENPPLFLSLSLVGTTIPGAVFTGIATGDQAGFSVAGGDGLWPASPSAVLIGAPGRQVAANAGAGSAYLVFRSTPPHSGTIALSRVANGLGDQVNGIVYQGAAANDHLGFSVAFPGEVTAAAGADVAFGAPWADPVLLDLSQPIDAGTLYVPSGGNVTSAVVSAGTIGASTAGARFVGIQAGMLLGYSVAGGGDNFTDGRADLLIGAPLYDLNTAFTSFAPATAIANVGLAAQASSGSDGIIEVCNQVGNDGATVPVVGRIWTGEQADDQLGAAVSGLGDVDGDGLDDIALGAPLADPLGLSQAGAVYVIHGAPPVDAYPGFVSTGTVGTMTAGVVLVGTQPGEHAGASVAGIGDFNDGGRNDFVIGAPNIDANTGTVYIVLTEDEDADQRPDARDCSPDDADLWSVPEAARSLILSHDRGTGVSTVAWTAPLEPGGLGAIGYDTIRSPSRTDFVTAAVCVETDGTDTNSSDTFNPAPGTMAFYLVVAQNSCGPGSAGTSSSGVEHNARTCP